MALNTHNQNGPINGLKSFGHEIYQTPFYYFFISPPSRLYKVIRKKTHSIRFLLWLFLPIKRQKKQQMGAAMKREWKYKKRSSFLIIVMLLKAQKWAFLRSAARNNTNTILFPFPLEVRIHGLLFLIFFGISNSISRYFIKIIK